MHHSEHDMELMLKDYRLTTAEIIYHMPDFHDILQSFVWQKMDIAPKFPVLNEFLDFWDRELEGPIHSVKVMSCQVVQPGDCRFVLGEYSVH